MVKKPKVKKPKVKPKSEPVSVQPDRESKPERAKPTLKQRIDKVIDREGIDEDIKAGLKKDLFNLFQRVLYPDQFCPKCDERLFYSPKGWSCPNCGYVHNPSVQDLKPQAPRPSQTGKVPPQVEKVIQQSQEDMKNPRRVSNPTKIGDKIRKLVDQRDSGGLSGPTPQDEAKVRGDKNVGSGKINWV